MKQQTGQNFDVWADSVAIQGAKVIIDTLIPVMEALERLHSEGKAHGAINPENLRVMAGKVDVGYFETRAGSTPPDPGSNYAAPEAISSCPPPARTGGDIYSIAAVLYRAISGQTPPATTRRLKTMQAELAVPESLDPAIRKALALGMMLAESERPDIKTFRQMLEPQNRALTPSAESYQSKRAGKIYPAHSASKGNQAYAPFVPLTLPANEPCVSAVPLATSPPTSAPAPLSTPSPAPQPVPKTVERLSLNLTVGKSCEIPIAKFFKEAIGTWRVNFLNGEALGLVLDPARSVVAATPKLAGEHKLSIELNEPNNAGKPTLHREVAVTINPDPDSLWRTLPSDTTDPYYKPDTDHGGILTTEGRMFAASQRGRSHAHEGLFRDDDFVIKLHQSTGWHLLAAADGAGSAKYSRRGSQIACGEALSFMERWIVEQRSSLDAAMSALNETNDARAMRTSAYSWLGGAAFEAQKAIRSEADQHEPAATIRDYATTLLLAAAKHTQTGWVIVAFSIGDGGIGLLRTDGQVKILCTPDSGEYGGQTVFLTATDALANADKTMRRVHTAHEANLKALVLMTDGVTDPKFPTEASLSDATVWKTFWRELTSDVDFRNDNVDAAGQLLKWLSFRSPGNHDDRTIALLLPNPHPSPNTL